MSVIIQVPFYPSDWLAGTRGMTAAEMGVYLTLIAMTYERAGPVKCDDKAKLARLCGTSASAFKIILAGLVDDDKLCLKDGAIQQGRYFYEFRQQQRQRRQPIGWQETRLRVFTRDSFTCTYCRSTDGPFECDHIIPVARGGGDEDENLTTACKSCNASKGAKMLEEWL